MDDNGAGEAAEPVEVTKEGPEWKHVVIKELRKMQQPKVTCIYCNKDFCGGATRIRAHILGDKPAVGVAACHVVRRTHPAVVVEMRKLQKEKDDMADQKLKRKKLWDLSKSMAAEGNQRQLRQNNLPRAFQAMESEGVDDAWAKCFYANGLPFRLSEDVYFKDAIKATLLHAQTTYVPPSCWKLSHSLLDNAVGSLSRDLQVW